MVWFKDESGVEPLYEAGDLERRARAHELRGRFEVAADLLKKALQIRQQAAPGTEYDLLNQLGFVYVRMQRYQDSMPIFQQAIEMIEQEFYANHPKVAPVLDHWALASIGLGNLDQAEQLLKRSLQIKQTCLLQQDTDTLETMRTLAEIQRKLGKYADAEAILKKAMVYVEPATISPLEEFLYEQALLAQAQGKTQEAEPLFERALATFAHRHGKNRRFATCLLSFAEFLRGMDRNEQADRLERESREIIDQDAGPRVPQNTAGTLYLERQLYPSTILH